MKKKYDNLCTSIFKETVVLRRSRSERLTLGIKPVDNDKLPLLVAN